MSKDPDARALPPGLPEGAVLRRALLELHSDADFEAFCQDYFPQVHRRFSAGMDRLSKINLLLQTEELPSIRRWLVANSRLMQMGQAAIDLLGATPMTEEDRHAQAQDNKIGELWLKRSELREKGESIVLIDEQIADIKRARRPSPRLVQGDLLDERYRLLERVGSGGFAQVWKAQDLTTKRVVAVKILHPHLSHEPRRRERFYRGAQRMQGLNHPHIVRLLDGPTVYQDFDYFVMDYLPGGDLFQAVTTGKLDRAAAVRAILSVGGALEYAHGEGLIHRDVKPPNILLDAKGTALLTDFDLVWAPDTTGGTSTGFMGTHIYTAPEQAEDAKSIDHRADVYSLGMTTLFVIYGKAIPQRAPYERERFIAKLNCPEPLKAMLLRAIALDAEDRPPDMNTFCAELSAAWTKGIVFSSVQLDAENILLASLSPLAKAAVMGTTAAFRARRWSSPNDSGSHQLAIGLKQTQKDLADATQQVEALQVRVAREAQVEKEAEARRESQAEREERQYTGMRCGRCGRLTMGSGGGINCCGNCGYITDD